MALDNDATENKAVMRIERSEASECPHCGTKRALVVQTPGSDPTIFCEHCKEGVAIDPAMTFNPEALAADGVWYGNGCYFASAADCGAWAFGLLLRWTGCSDTRTVPSWEKANR